MRDVFRRMSEASSQALGTPAAFLAATAIVILWAMSGPYFQYSDTWQLVINTSTTIVTFLMVFLIQATQNRDTKILNLKMDELLRALEGARNEFSDLDQMTDDDLEAVQAQFRALNAKAGSLARDDIAAIDLEIDRRKKREIGTSDRRSGGHNL